MDNNLKEYYKEQDALMKKYRLLPNKYTGQVILIFFPLIMIASMPG